MLVCLRFDMHAAFKDNPMVLTELKNVCNKIQGTSRPRYGYFIQPEFCATINPSGTNRIPTFTCNFLATLVESEGRMNEIMENLFEISPTLRKELLRVRCEAGFFPKFEKGELKIVHSSDFPKEVLGDQYYDAHIHILDKDWRKIAKIGQELGMPIIANVLKDPICPFLTARWYNCTLDDALEALKQKYHELSKELHPKPFCEFEVTMNDPDCNVTDLGWLPVPLEEEYLVQPKEIECIN